MAPYCFGLGHCCVSSNLHIQLRQFNIPFIMHMGGGNGSLSVWVICCYTCGSNLVNLGRSPSSLRSSRSHFSTTRISADDSPLARRSLSSVTSSMSEKRCTRPIWQHNALVYAILY